MKYVSLLLIAFLSLAGCTPIDQSARENSVVLHEKRKCVLTILVDLSGLFHEKMLENGKAHQFCIDAVDSYFRNRIGSNDEVVIAQISGGHRALLWQGTPMQLRKDFSSPEKLNAFFRDNAAGGGSNVYSNIAQSVDFVASDPDVIGGHAKSCILVLSDMADNDVNQAEARQRLQQSLANYAQHGGVVGCYFVDQTLVADTRAFLASTGLQKFVVEAEINGNPQLPAIY